MPSPRSQGHLLEEGGFEPYSISVLKYGFFFFLKKNKARDDSS